MAFTWIRESPAHWDADKARIVGRAVPGSFPQRYADLADGDLVPGEWWRVEDRDRVVGYGWLEVGWNDGEMLLATDPDARGQGVGSFVLEHLAGEARSRGLNYLHNVVAADHPSRDTVDRWLRKRGFVPDRDGRLFRAVVGGGRATPPPT